MEDEFTLRLAAVKQHHADKATVDLLMRDPAGVCGGHHARVAGERESEIGTEGEHVRECPSCKRPLPPRTPRAILDEINRRAPWFSDAESIPATGEKLKALTELMVELAEAVERTARCFTNSRLTAGQPALSVEISPMRHGMPSKPATRRGRGARRRRGDPLRRRGRGDRPDRRVEAAG